MSTSSRDLKGARHEFMYITTKGRTHQEGFIQHIEIGGSEVAAFILEGLVKVGEGCLLLLTVSQDQAGVRPRVRVIPVWGGGSRQNERRDLIRRQYEAEEGAWDTVKDKPNPSKSACSYRERRLFLRIMQSNPTATGDIQAYEQRTQTN